MRFSKLFTSLFLSLAALGSAAHADQYPEKPITVIVPFAAGGPTDASARALANALSDKLNTPFVVENLPGAGGSIATARAANAAPDGYTLLWGTGSALSILPNLRTVPYNATSSFTPISLVVSAPFIMAVNPKLNVKTVNEFVALARSRPNELNYSSSGTGGTAHMIGELFNMRAEVDAVHVPYNGGAPMMQAVVAGDVDYSFDTPHSIVQLTKAERIVPLAVTGLQRWPALPEVPTLHELGYTNFDATTWFGLLAPARTPEDRVKKIGDAVQQVLAEGDTRATLERIGFFVEGTSSEDFARKIREDNEQWAKLIEHAKISITN